MAKLDLTDEEKATILAMAIGSIATSLDQNKWNLASTLLDTAEKVFSSMDDQSDDVCKAIKQLRSVVNLGVEIQEQG